MTDILIYVLLYTYRVFVTFYLNIRKFTWTGVKSTLVMLCIVNIPRTMDKVQQNVGIMNQPFLQTFRESQIFLSWR
jgi:hypothetical protein